MKSLTRKEELIMLSILHLKKNAYLIAMLTISVQAVNAAMSDPVDSLRYE